MKNVRESVKVAEWIPAVYGGPGGKNGKTD